MKLKISSTVLFSAAMIVALSSFSGESGILKLATTTSTMNSGLLDYLLPQFESKYGIKVRVIAVGTGKALKLSENGDVDLVMVHAPASEIQFVQSGYGVNRRPFMKNDFVIIGPPDDPAKLREAGNINSALDRLKKSEAVFISRGDDSGTHKKELSLWKITGGPPPAPRYLEIGQGMEAALRMADEKRAYTISDRGTYLALKKTLDLGVAFEGAPELDNQYSAIATNPARFPDLNYMDAMLLIAWLTGPEGQKKIGSYRIDGELLFYPTTMPEN
jgi:tungstate transport system substrate-binding protein